MIELTEKDKKFLLNLSRTALEEIFKTNKSYTLESNDVPQKFEKQRATFVTLTKKGNLRGCMGRLIASRPIYKDIINNTYAAAFEDPRFPQLKKEELKEIKIEISLLSEPKKLNYKNTTELIKKLGKDKPGVILKRDFYSATYLPQVWDTLTEVESFLTSLCEKAGLEPDTWEKEKIEIQTYEVVSMEED